MLYDLTLTIHIVKTRSLVAAHWHKYLLFSSILIWYWCFSLKDLKKSKSLVNGLTLRIYVVVEERKKTRLDCKDKTLQSLFHSLGGFRRVSDDQDDAFGIHPRSTVNHYVVAMNHSNRFSDDTTVSTAGGGEYVIMPRLTDLAGSFSGLSHYHNHT